MFKYSDYQINPLRVSSRWKQTQADPLDVQWARKRKQQRILRQVARSQKGVDTGTILGWLKAKNDEVEAKARAMADNHYRGQEYQYNRYRAPQQPGDVVIAFAGATQGPGRGMDRYMAYRYGKGNYAIFRPGDVPKAIEFAKSLPEGTRLFVEGHSHGGGAVATFVQSGLPIARVITYDPVSGVNKPGEVPSNVKKWYNAIAGDYDYQSGHKGLKWLGKKIGSDVADVFIRGAGKWGRIKGAENVMVPQASHSDVKKMYNALNKKMRDRIQYGA